MENPINQSETGESISLTPCKNKNKKQNKNKSLTKNFFLLRKIFLN